MRRVLSLGAILLSLAGCTPSGQAANRPSRPATQVASPVPSAAPSGSPAAAAASPSPTAASGPTPQVTCSSDNSAGHPLALVNAGAQGQLLFDVSDPIHPRELCRLRDVDQVVLESGTKFEYLAAVGGLISIVRQTIGGTSSVVGSLPLSSTGGVRWRPDGLYAYQTSMPSADGSCCGSSDEHLVSNGKDDLFCHYQIPIVGLGPTRFGIGSLRAFSADGRYYALTTLSGKGGTSCNLIVDTADGSIAAQVPSSGGIMGGGFWAPAGHRLYLYGPNGVRSWSPEAGFSSVTGDGGWVGAGASSDGRYAAYTYYQDPLAQTLRVGIFDLNARKVLAGLPDAPRSQAAFVTASVAWYLEEAPCTDQKQCYWPTTSDGRVLAFDIQSGTESQVVYAAGSTPLTMEDYAGFGVLASWSPS